MSDNEPDEFDGTEEDQHRRDLSRAFLECLRPTARLRIEYRRALQDLAQSSQIQRDPAEDDLEQDLDWELETLAARCPDPLLIEGELSESEATKILERQGGFEKNTFEVDEELASALEEALRQSREHPESLIPFEQVKADMSARMEEHRRTVDNRPYLDREKALDAMR